MTTTTLTPRGEREQRTFRALLNCMARPGQIGQVPLHDTTSPWAAALSVFEALVDHEVNFTVIPSRPEVIDAVLRLTGSRVTSLEEADYVLCKAEALAGVLNDVKEGTLEYPDRGATVVCLVDAIVPEGEELLTLSGPGIRTTTPLAVTGFSAEARTALCERNSHPPLGIDVVFVTESGRIACLNRNTKLIKERA